MPKQRYDLVVCGAGIAGVSAAYFLTLSGINNVLLLDANPPLSLTSDHSTECYRNWWPDQAMLGLMNHSIDLMERLAEQSGNIFQMNRRGYLYLTGDRQNSNAFIERAQLISNLGGGPLRKHTSQHSDYQYCMDKPFYQQPAGADLLLDPGLIQKNFPYLTDRVTAALHVRRAGWLSAQQLGMYLFEQARKRGVQFQTGQLTDIQTVSGGVASITINNNQRIDTGGVINAAGPFFKQVGGMLGLDLPVFAELHLKAAFKDAQAVICRDAPLLIWNDTQRLPWSEAERSVISEGTDSRWLLNELPGGVHTRPEGGADSRMVLMLWEYKTNKMEPVFPPPLDPYYPEMALRGLVRMIPGLGDYLAHLPRPILDGGYYTKTVENRPLIGRSPIQGLYLIGALSGYGIMSACAAGELLAAQITQAKLPAYAADFALQRYEDPDYLSALKNIDDGQL